MSSVELQEQTRPSLSESVASRQSNHTEPLARRAPQHLQPTDQGLSAWKVLLAAFMLEGMLFGFPQAFGIFQQYYNSQAQFAGSKLIPYIGTIATGITYLGAPVLAPAVKYFPHYRRHLIFVGWVLCLAGLIGGSFADTIAGLVLTQGVLYGTGYLIIFYPVVNLLNEWWVVKRGFAWGILLGSGGLAGVVFPFINEALLQKYGYQITLRAMAVATVILTGPLLPFLQARLPPSRNIVLARTNWAFLRKPIFWLYISSTIAQSLGFYLPTLYLPAYASAAGLAPQIGAMLIALVNVASVLGQFMFGWLSDRQVSVQLLVLSTSVMAAVSSLTLWGLAQSLTFLILFALIYGFFAYANLALRVRIGTAIASEPSDSMTTFCILSFGQGIGNVLAGPISGALIEADINVHEYGYVRYKPLVIFTGVSMIASAVCIVLSYLVPARLRN